MMDIAKSETFKNFIILNKALLFLIIKFRFVKFFDRHNIFYAHQYGLRKKHRVIHALLDVILLSYDDIQVSNTLLSY